MSRSVSQNNRITHAEQYSRKNFSKYSDDDKNFVKIYADDFRQEPQWCSIHYVYNFRGKNLIAPSLEKLYHYQQLYST